MKTAVLLIAAAFVAVCSAAPKQQRVMVEAVPMMSLTKATKIGGNLGFSYSNCAAGSNLDIKTLTISPNPIVIPGTVTVELDATIATEITAITSAEIILKKNVFGIDIEIPCVDNLGSCTYNDICSLLAKVECPKELIEHGFRCQCPFAAKEFKIPAGTTVPLPSLPLPSFAQDGEYDIKVTLKNGDTTLGCYDFKVSLKKASSFHEHNDVEILV